MLLRSFCHPSNNRLAIDHKVLCHLSFLCTLTYFHPYSLPSNSRFRSPFILKSFCIGCSPSSSSPASIHLTHTQSYFLSRSGELLVKVVNNLRMGSLKGSQKFILERKVLGVEVLRERRERGGRDSWRVLGSVDWRDWVFGS